MPGINRALDCLHYDVPVLRSCRCSVASSLSRQASSRRAWPLSSEASRLVDLRSSLLADIFGGN